MEGPLLGGTYLPPRRFVTRTVHIDGHCAEMSLLTTISGALVIQKQPPIPPNPPSFQRPRGIGKTLTIGRVGVDDP